MKPLVFATVVHALSLKLSIYEITFVYKTILYLRSQGEFSTIIELPEGEHEYKFCVDGRWIHDPNAVSTIKYFNRNDYTSDVMLVRVYSNQSIDMWYSFI